MPFHEKNSSFVQRFHPGNRIALVHGHVYDRKGGWTKKLTVEILGNILLKIKWKR